MHGKPSNIDDEQLYLTRVLQLMDRQIAELEATVDDRQAEIVDMKRHFWDEVTVDKDEMFETYVSIMQQAKDLASHERVQAHAAKWMNKLRKHIDSPYFGRVDFVETTDTEVLPVYIGLMSVTDEAIGEHLVYDWRTPIASLFYDYAPGPVRYRTPAGLIEGEMKLKRQYLIRGGRLEAVFDTGIQIGDDMLQEMLKRSADTKMKSIVSTIQREQNAIIRDDAHDVLIVQGAAGSGKTSAAMQRIAYLLYKYRDSMRSEQIVLFSPNDLFNDYVSNILPELGESNMTQTTYQSYIEHRLVTERRIEDIYDQKERLMGAAAEHAEPSAGEDGAGIEASAARWKASASYKLVLDAYIDSLKREGMRFIRFGTPKRTIIPAERLAEQFYGPLADWSLPARMDKLKDWVLTELKAWAEREVKRVYRKLAAQPNYMGTDDELRSMSRKQVNKWLKLMRMQAKKLRFVEWEEMYLDLMRGLSDWIEQVGVTVLDPGAPMEPASAGRYADGIGTRTVERFEAGVIPFEDASPLLYLIESVEGFDTFNHIRHVVMDEAQDYSPFQYALLKRLFPRSRFTILGDWNQAIYEANRMSSIASVEEMFADKRVGVIRLTKSYRSTLEIMELARTVLPYGEEAEPFNRAGEKPELHMLADEAERLQFLDSCLQRMKSDKLQSTAIITKDEAAAERVHAQLQALHPQLKRVSKHTKQFVSGQWVVPSYLAKGLEFDAVIVFDAEEQTYGHESDRKLFYTVCTRALHRLTFLAVGQPTPFLNNGGEYIK
ncbi:RNA polymerase recycling motor HelD [Paenibacillus apiarius]|uniref:UvrD-helicase domain-containing protein n=1 Tax=Paenibacillus apiarius TaxID=46240 RepID=A0ABT4DWG7_9BACL|nr:RNA polymerase recycling motor HelD [Paenibacillus apiarius]MCY9516864.1 UvrD-helicase domain-containing protein [Paenibacillus apiarius]MCY9521697.1 UvrD-helicase domain-containing protein [Paenibacillus apiarius]MCY9554078.1 UvrD-helicase domain-containing protein [Paenibacillus apiarius]MCY9558863.1 UvrD-helicase domain-containing protein [Paenibacillus apiarius]MCY9683909.1 UvrD-helicase domain-containing protein [Paenibacillus apiarius]